MITLYLIVLVCFLYSLITTKIKAKKDNQEWNPFDYGYKHYMSLVLGGTALLTTTIFIILKYLP